MACIFVLHTTNNGISIFYPVIIQKIDMDITQIGYLFNIEILLEINNTDFAENSENMICAVIYIH